MNYLNLRLKNINKQVWTRDVKNPKTEYNLIRTQKKSEKPDPNCRWTVHGLYTKIMKV